MTRTMFDGITPGSVPPGAQLYAAYLDGHWADFTAMVARYPGALHVSVAVSSSYNAGQVLDVENGDATPEEAVNWVLGRRHAGTDPTVYCSMSAWPTVKATFATHDVPQPHYWVADYSLGNNPAIPAGAIALQYADRGGYDVSVVADYWPGIDPAPTPPPPEADMDLISVTPDPTDPTSKGSGIFSVSGGRIVHVPDATTLKGLESKWGQPVPVTPAYYQNLLAAQTTVTVDATQLAAALAPLLPAAPTAAENAAAVAALIGSDLKT